MDYEKKYKEANDKVAVRFGTNVAKEIFTDLYESEDERIRKAIIDIIKAQKEQQCHIDSTIYDEMIAWLEKQAAQKPFDYENANIQQKDFAPQVEQKPAWSEEDENIRQWIISDIDKLLALKKKSYIIADKEINWLKSLKGRIQLQNRWKPSDEQMEALLYEVNAWDKDSVNGQNLKSLYQELKKLREE